MSSISMGFAREPATYCTRRDGWRCRRVRGAMVGRFVGLLVRSCDVVVRARRNGESKHRINSMRAKAVNRANWIEYILLSLQGVRAAMRSSARV